MPSKRARTILRPSRKRKLVKKKRPAPASPGGTITTVARRLQLFADAEGPDWLKTLMRWTHIALSIYGFLVGSEGKEAPKEEKIIALGGVVGIDLGPDDLIAESPYVNGFPPEQVTSWDLRGVDYSMYSQARIHWIKIRIIPQMAMAARGGTLITALEPIPLDASEFEGIKKAGERLDSITSILSMPSAQSTSFDRHVVRHFRGPKGWQAIGVPGTAVEGAKATGGKVSWSWPLSKYASSASVCGGRPICRLWLAYESINHLTATTSDSVDLEHFTVDLEITSRIEFRAPTGQPIIEKVDDVTVMNVSTGSITRRMPITVEAGRVLQLTDGRRLKHRPEAKVVTGAALSRELESLSLSSSPGYEVI